MTEGQHTADNGWTFIARRNDGRETYRTVWRSPEGKRGILRDRMTVEMIETFDPDQDWARGAAEFAARRAS